MSLGVALDVAIGLIFTYLLLGLLASALQEFWAGWRNLRGEHLRRAVEEMLDGKLSGSIFGQVFGHGLVQGLMPPGKIPSYVPARNFALALFDVLSTGSHAPLFGQIESAVAMLPQGDSKQSLTTLVKQAGGDIDKLRAGVEKWFDDTMDRTSGIYKRQTQLFAFGLGLVIAVGLNVDSIHIAQTLWTNGDARAAIVARAQQYVASTPDPAGTKDPAAYARCALDQLPLPIGWATQQPSATGSATPSAASPCAEGTSASSKTHYSPQISQVLSDMLSERGVWLFIGWLITGCAVSLGAPFWFDMLKNVFNVRAAGPKPPRADDAPSRP